MNLAKVRYNGPMTSQRYRGPSGEVYNFKNPMGGKSRPLTVENVEDVRTFDNNDAYDVNWTVLGRIATSTKEPVEALRDMGYRKKQQLAKQFDIRANQSADSLEDELQPHVEELVKEEF